MKPDFPVAAPVMIPTTVVVKIEPSHTFMNLYRKLVAVCIYIWVVVKIMIPFWVRNIIRHLIFRVPQKGTLVLTTTHMIA